MNARTRTRRLIAWLALCAMLLASLMPTLSRAVLGSPPALHAMAEICQTGTTDHGHAAGPTHGNEHAPAGHLEHCPYCRIQSDLPGILPASTAPICPGATHAAHPVLFYLSPRPLFTWTKAQPRAPPAVS